MDTLGVIVAAGLILYLLSNRQELFGDVLPVSDSGGASPPPPVVTSDVVSRLSEAIARAEGFYVSGSIPQRQNNPGDLTAGGTIMTFATAADGWNALHD